VLPLIFRPVPDVLAGAIWAGAVARSGPGDVDVGLARVPALLHTDPRRCRPDGLIPLSLQLVELRVGRSWPGHVAIPPRFFTSCRRRWCDAGSFCIRANSFSATASRSTRDAAAAASRQRRTWANSWRRRPGSRPQTLRARASAWAPDTPR